MNRPIGVFDSGLGGLTVFKEIIDILPNENIVYFGDTQRVPYGSRSRETIIEYTFQAINFLISKNVKVVVIACNTATAMALDLARKKYSIPIIGVIKAGSKTVVNTTKNNIIGVIGTDATIKSNSYSKEIKNLNKDITVIQSPCPLFVPIVEEGWANTEIARLTAKKYLDDLINKDIDSLVLGCTHYPILQKTIKEVTMGKINLVNPAKETAKELIELLKENKTLNNCAEKISYDYYVSDTPQKFLQIADDFLNIK
ncbi:MAG: glutamate racemase, partial [Peptostreptococcaceae bacterium]